MPPRLPGPKTLAEALKCLPGLAHKIYAIHAVVIAINEVRDYSFHLISLAKRYLHCLHALTRATRLLSLSFYKANATPVWKLLMNRTTFETLQANCSTCLQIGSSEYRVFHAILLPKVILISASTWSVTSTEAGSRLGSEEENQAF